MKPTAITTNLTFATDLYGRAVKNPKIILLTGESGWGKTQTGKFLAEEYGAMYWNCPPLPKSSSQYPFYNSLCGAFGAKPRSSTDGLTMLERLIDRPLFIDCAERLFHRRQQDLPEIVEYLHNVTEQPIILAGLPDMEGLSAKYSKLLNRSQFCYFQPLTGQDTKDIIARCCEIQVRADLANRIHSFAKGNGWHIRLAVEEIEQFALGDGLKEIGLKEYGSPRFAQQRRTA